MQQQGVFGERLGRSFHLGDPPTLLASTPAGHALAATEIRFDQAGCGLTAPLGNDDAYLIGLQFRGLHHHELWLDGVPVSVRPVSKGGSCFYDLRRDPIAYLGEPFHSLNFYVPRQALAELAEELGQPAVSDLAYEAGDFVDDPVIGSLGQCLLPVMHGQQRANQLFTDHMLLALRGHLLATYGRTRTAACFARGGLAPWQQRKATELIREHVVEGIALAELAQACRLSSSAFVRAFKKSLGVPPHQWLLLRRLDRAIELMRDRGIQLADVALSAGFADQSHFTRTFARKMGVSPGAWRSASCH
jgi:AraC family transcriptional regulator